VESGRVDQTVVVGGDRDLPGWTGAALLVLWLCLVAAGFWQIFGLQPPFGAVVPLHSPATMAALERWFRSLAQRWRARTRRSRWFDTAGRPAAPTALRSAPLPRLPAGADLLIFSPGGRLEYGGPMRTAGYCGSGSYAEAVLGRLRRGKAPAGAVAAAPILLQSGCRCG